MTPEPPRGSGMGWLWLIGSVLIWAAVLYVAAGVQGWPT